MVGCDILLLAHGHHLVLPVSVLQLWAPMGLLWPGVGWRKLRRWCYQCLVNQWLSVVVRTIFLVCISKFDRFFVLIKYVGRHLYLSDCETDQLRYPFSDSILLSFLHSKYVLNYSNDISDGVGLPDWRLALCLGAAWVILFCTLVKGVQSSGKVRAERKCLLRELHYEQCPVFMRKWRYCRLK